MSTMAFHPTLQELNDYATRDLPESSAANIEEHLLMCERCRSLVEDADENFAALRQALKELESKRFIQ